MAIGTNSTFPPQIVRTCCGEVLFRAKSGRGVKLATNLSLVPNLKLVELYLHDPMFLRGLYRDIFTFTFNVPNRSVYLHVDLLASKVQPATHSSRRTFLRIILKFWKQKVTCHSRDRKATISIRCPTCTCTVRYCTVRYHKTFP